jgi:hypothetical protein
VKSQFYTNTIYLNREKINCNIIHNREQNDWKFTNKKKDITKISQTDHKNCHTIKIIITVENVMIGNSKQKKKINMGIRRERDHTNCRTIKIIITVENVMIGNSKRKKK